MFEESTHAVPKRSQLYQIYDKPVPGSQYTVRSAKALIGTTALSIIPQPDNPDRLEVAFFEQNYKVEKQIGDALFLNAGPIDIEEIADFLTRYLTQGAEPQDLLNLLRDMKGKASDQEIEEWRSQFSDAAKRILKK